MEHLGDKTSDDDIESIDTYQAVLPYNDSEHERSHAENIIGLEPVDVGGEESCLKDHGEVDKVTEIYETVQRFNMEN